MSQQTNHTLRLRIHGMEEVAFLKRELVPLLGDDDRLAFDLIRGKLVCVRRTAD